VILCGVLSGLTACGGSRSFECEGIRAVVTGVDSADAFTDPVGSSNQARPGFRLVQVVMEPSQGETSLSWCELALSDTQGNRYEPISKAWQLIGHGEYVWIYEVPDTASGFRLVLPDGEQVDLGL
jgi:hypothetical protein